MQTHIAVPLDGSSFAETILPHATALARATSARVTLLRVIPPVTSFGSKRWPGRATTWRK
ncbi:MAG: universal stress protein [Chloroflexi bacterium]|nr:MAG: universal stress protein [Chloroflexota bacterium]